MESVPQLLSNDDTTEGDVSTRHALRKGQHVRHDTIVLDAEPSTGSTESGDHFVSDHQDIKSITHLAECAKITGRGDNDTAGSQHRFDDERRDILGSELRDDVGKGLARIDRAASRVAWDAGVAAITVRGRSPYEAWHDRAKIGVVLLQPGRSGRGKTKPVVPTIVADDDCLGRLSQELPIESCHLEGCLVRLAAAGREHD